MWNPLREMTKKYESTVGVGHSESYVKLENYN